MKKVLLEISQNSQENTRVRIYFLIKLQATLAETLAQVFSCEFCEIFENIEHLWWLLLVFIFYYVFFFFFDCLFFLFVIIFNHSLLLGKSYFNAATLSEVINN